MNRLFKKSINSNIKKIYENNTVIKEIDFKADIDIVNSGKFMYYDEGIRYLGNLNNIDRLDECIKVLGDYKVEYKQIIFEGKQYPSIYEETQVSRIILNKAFNEDIFSFSISRNVKNCGKSFQFVSLFKDSSYYNTLVNVSNNVMSFKNVKNYKLTQFQIAFQDEKVSVNIYKGYEKKELFSFESNNNNIDVLINRKKGQLLIDENDINCSNFFDKNSMLYVLLGSNESLIESEKEFPRICDIYFGSDTGYIYMKPITLDKSLYNEKTFKIQTIEKGNLDIEIYLDSTEKWINIKNINIINDLSVLKIRIKMKSMDCLYSIIVYQDNEIHLRS